MSDTKSTVEIELEKADRFTKSRISYVVWSRQQGKKLREVTAAAYAENNQLTVNWGAVLLDGAPVTYDDNYEATSGSGVPAEAVKPPSPGNTVADRFNAV